MAVVFPSVTTNHSSRCSMKRPALWRLALCLVVATTTADAFSISATNNKNQRGLTQRRFRSRIHTTEEWLLRAAATSPDTSVLNDFETAFAEVESTITKACKVKLAPSSSSTKQGLGLVATQSVNKGDVLLAVPYSSEATLTAAKARETFASVLPDKYDGWTGDTGLIALALLNEVALAATTGDGGIAIKPKRSSSVQSFMSAWLATLPGIMESDNNGGAVDAKQQYPLLWPEDDQEVLQSSSTTKVYRILDDIEEDVAWLTTNVFDKDRNTFPESVTLLGDNDKEVPCFSLDGFTWAMAMVQSRSFFLDQALRLIPMLDGVNHDDDAEEVQSGYMGALRTIQGAQLVASKSYKAGEEVFCSYGPKSAVDYLLEHGFVPEQCWKTNVSELTFEVDSEDRFYDDKLDVLEFETYDAAPMDPSQSFDVVAAPGRSDGEPDPALIQFVRLCQLGGTDAFLLESIFRKEVWDFMSYPVSEQNELAVVNAITETCQRALEEFQDCPQQQDDDDDGSSPNSSICRRLRESETIALTKTVEFLKREKEALDLKEYYQERRLRDLGLDSDWSPEDDVMGGGDADLGFGQTRVPGGADYDW